MADPTEALLNVLRTIVVPLVEADGGVLYLVSCTKDRVTLHLAGSCAGCPGFDATSLQVILPALKATVPKVKLQASAGWIIPKGAKRLRSKK